MTAYSVTEGRIFSRLEQQMIWQKPASHQTSQEELRIAQEIRTNWDDPEMKLFNILLEGDAGSGKTQLAKALSADLQLPYTKVTCFADMDKSDIFGALLPIVATDDDLDSDLLEAIHQTDSFDAVLQLIQQHYSIPKETAKERLTQLIQRVEEREQEVVHYKFYPSEIVRAMEKGYLLEIQEPTVIRDASVLVALNSALESHGMLNIPTGIVQRHSDCVVVITTNRNYQGNRPLNESLRDRMQHAEKMDLPALSVMTERAQAKTGVNEPELLLKMAEIIRLLDQTAKANAIKGVAGMRSYFYWVNTLRQEQNPLETIYPKVFYKLTTDPDELAILEQALEESGYLTELLMLLQKNPLQEFKGEKPKISGRKISAAEADLRNIDQTEEEEASLVNSNDELTSDATEEGSDDTNDSEEENSKEGLEVNEKKKSQDLTATGDEKEAEELEEETGMSPSEMEAFDKEKKRQLNKEARQVLKETMHAKEGLIVHRPSFTKADQLTAREAKQKILPIVDRLSRKVLDLLDKEVSSTYQTGKVEGHRFNASRIAYGDFKNFDKKNPPHEEPSLALAIRVDESGSMIRDGRMTSAQLATLAIAEFAKRLAIPLVIYGDTADVSAREKTSLFSYKEFDDSFDYVDAKIMAMKPRQNNRDGVVLKILADKLEKQTATTKLLLTISDGQPKALPDYTGAKAKEDIQAVLKEYERQGILFLSAAIGQDKEVIKEIYGENRYLDSGDLETFPERMIQLIARYL
ncbi:hypothetical protein BAU15_12485 [Enterococcus sp. JM4C]|uniref:AAA family ATPase n=1 Tax=Candidatus Enterococcus huntleyi TaxID=1857217 RepID=UPI00137A8DE3|nr:AAA family ATPase [Enterococcus sp. JM4C]KAF1296090.1 hypothetical protein BAU15_12485 [Enterococcus sp. JM4C]